MDGMSQWGAKGMADEGYDYKQIPKLPQHDYYEGLTDMNVDLYDFELPEHLIAHTALDRSSSRLLTLDKQSGDIRHQTFADIIDYLNPEIRLY